MRDIEAVRNSQEFVSATMTTSDDLTIAALAIAIYLEEPLIWIPAQLEGTKVVRTVAQVIFDDMTYPETFYNVAVRINQTIILVGHVRIK